ncbi:hypothetical protein DY000_02017076 [Brassica cretica]|uniref:Uncharacterized protein n=1 Tax=Brassica cretica TaxID=69181 RepID=A0ABQ7CZP3_BRACR|nr:hypothetical protein DY000_02017076 [Brassica cretica]
MMIRAPVMMIRDLAMTTSAPAMTTSASAMTIRALEAVVGGLIRRHPAGRSAKAYMFCDTGLAGILRTAVRCDPLDD